MVKYIYIDNMLFSYPFVKKIVDVFFERLNQQAHHQA